MTAPAEALARRSEGATSAALAAIGGRHIVELPRAGVVRKAFALASPARVVVDLSNRPHLEFRAGPDTPSAPNFPFTLVEEFCRALASNLRANIHVELLYGRDGHHIAEAIFKGLARALRDACEKDPRVKGIPSTKEAL